MQEYEQQQNQRIKESGEMQRQLAEVIAQNEKLKIERDKGSEKYRAKASEYKNRLKVALQNMHTLA
jgi:regulator of replication initiation timing